MKRKRHAEICMHIPFEKDRCLVGETIFLPGQSEAVIRVISSAPINEGRKII